MEHLNSLSQSDWKSELNLIKLFSYCINIELFTHVLQQHLTATRLIDVEVFLSVPFRIDFDL